jgi:SAM-dependent methyltransferase
MPGGDEIRDVQRVTWAGLSAGWEKWDSVIMDQLGPVGAAMIGRLGIAGDQQHLDIAAGTGEPGLTVARLAPGGHVVLTDLAAEMLDIATRRADAQGITNFETTVCSADDLPFGDAAFDSISVRFGYMFFPDLAKATAEFARVLKPGGRLCSSVWAGPGETRGRRSPCRQSRRKRCWRHPARTGRACSGALPRDMSVPCTRPRGCATLPSGTSTSSS